MSILTKLSTHLKARSEVAEVALAERLAATGDTDAIAELVQGLSGKDKGIASDCIKVLYEIAYRAPELIAPHLSAFVLLLKNRQNRLVWGAMTAIDTLTPLRPAEVYGYLPQILAAAEKGSVITNDHAVFILVELCRHAGYRETAMPFLMERLSAAPPNQLPTYAEKALTVMDAFTAPKLVDIVKGRLPGIESDSKRKRLEKVLAKAIKR